MTGGQDADRRAWHLAAAVDEPDDEVVAALDDAARRAAARGGFEAASAAFERAAELTGDEQARSTRLLAAATNAWLAAQLPRAMRLATTARAGVTDPVVRADLDRLRGRIEFVAGSVPVGVGIWSQAARDVVATDPQRAREIGMIATAGSTFLPEQDRTDLDPAELLASTAAGHLDPGPVLHPPADRVPPAEPRRPGRRRRFPAAGRHPRAATCPRRTC